MDKLQKVLNEVERLQNELITEKKNGNGSDVDDACITELQNVKDYIKSVQKEPESDDFEKALANEWKAYNDRGAATVDALEDNTQELAFAKGFYRGAKWKEQIIANAINGKVIANGMGNPILHLWDKGKHLIDKKVKVIVVKEE